MNDNPFIRPPVDLEAHMRKVAEDAQRAIDEQVGEYLHKMANVEPSDDGVIYFEESEPIFKAGDHGVPPHDPFAEFLRDDLAQQARKAQEGWARQKASYHQSSTAWDVPEGSPWLDVMNAGRLIRGEPKIIDARVPVGDVYQITEVE